MRRWVGDGLFAGGLLLFGLVTTRFAARNQPQSTHLDALAYVLIAIASSALAVRRHRPMIVLAVVTAATTGYLIRGYPYRPIVIAFSSPSTPWRRRPRCAGPPRSAASRWWH